MDLQYDSGSRGTSPKAPGRRQPAGPPQHAYSVTHVRDDGTVPRGRDMERNWEVPGLNNFRQNVQGELGSDAGPDVTVRGSC